MIYTLTGLMGSGKSTVGKLLAERHPGSVFIDLDMWIEQTEGRKIPEIFRIAGEEGFRDIETEALMDAVTSYESGIMFLSLGGGTLIRQRNREIIAAVSHCIYLQGSPATLAAHLSGAPSGRPLLEGAASQEERLSELLSARSAGYEAVARYTVEIDGKTPLEIAEEIERMTVLQ